MYNYGNPTPTYGGMVRGGGYPQAPVYPRPNPGVNPRGYYDYSANNPNSAVAMALDPRNIEAQNRMFEESEKRRAYVEHMRDLGLYPKPGEDKSKFFGNGGMYQPQQQPQPQYAYDVHGNLVMIDPYGNPVYVQPTPNMGNGHIMNNGVINDGSVFGAPQGAPQTMSYVNPNPQPTSEWTGGKYRPRTAEGEAVQKGWVTPPTSSYQQSQYVQPAPEVQQNIQTTQIPDSSFSEILARIDELETENIILKETLEMVTKMLNKDSKYPHLIGNAEKENLKEEKNIDAEGNITYTLYGSGLKDEPVEPFSIGRHVPTVKTREGEDVLAFMVNPVDTENTEINNIITVGEDISKGVMTGVVEQYQDHQMFRHCVKTGQVIVSAGDHDVTKNVEILLKSKLKKQLHEATEGEKAKALKETSKEIAEEVTTVLQMIKNGRGVVGKAIALDKIETQIELKGIKYFTKDMVDAIRFKLKSEYNDMIKNVLGLEMNGDPLPSFSSSVVEEADGILSGQDPTSPRAAEDVVKYHRAVTDLMMDFEAGLKLLQTSVDVVNKEGSKPQVTYVTKIVSSGTLYSYIDNNRSSVAGIMENSNGFNVVTKDSHKLLHKVIQSALAFENGFEDGKCPKGKEAKFNNFFIRVATESNDLSVVFKLQKVIYKGEHSIYVIKKIYEGR